MQRRKFLGLAALASVAPTRLLGAPPQDATVLYDDRTTSVLNMNRNPKDPAALWIRKRDLPRINDFELKPQGACRADLCIPVTRDMLQGDYFNLTAFAHKIRQPVLADAAARVWSFGEIQAVRGSFLNGRVAPDVSAPNREGRPVRLSDFRGKKVLLVTWASW